MRFELYVHGLLIGGAALFFVAALIAGNIEWTVGTTDASFWFSVLLSFILFFLAGLMWVSAAVNARQEEHYRR